MRKGAGLSLSQRMFPIWGEEPALQSPSAWALVTAAVLTRDHRAWGR